MFVYHVFVSMSQTLPVSVLRKRCLKDTEPCTEFKDRDHSCNIHDEITCLMGNLYHSQLEEMMELLRRPIIVMPPDSSEEEAAGVSDVNRHFQRLDMGSSIETDLETTAEEGDTIIQQSERKKKKRCCVLI